MGQIIVQSSNATLLVILTTNGIVPVTGIVPADVTVRYKRNNESSFTNKTIDNTNWIEYGNGVYGINFLGTPDLSVVGEFVYVVLGVKFQQYIGDAQLIPVTSTIPTTTVVLPTCIVTGHLVDAQGSPLVGASVSAQVIGVPTILGNNVGIGDNLATVTTDNNGVFNLSLLRLGYYSITIPAINYRRQAYIPNQTNVDLFTGIP
jgi:hypothetical protein